MYDSKLCRECKWHNLAVYDFGTNGLKRFNHECHHPDVVERTVCPVTGELKTQEASCFYQRAHHGTCGKDGRLWEKKNDDRVQHQSL